MTTLPFRPFDADNHYYEALDAFTRHLDPKRGPRTVQRPDGTIVTIYYIHDQPNGDRRIEATLWSVGGR